MKNVSFYKSSLKQDLFLEFLYIEELTPCPKC